MTENEINVKNKLRQLRKEQDLSQEELANHLGVSRQSIIALEQGKYLPSLPIVVSMCRFFNSAFEDIFGIEREIEQELEGVVKNNVKIGIINHPHIKEERKEKRMTELEPWRPFREAVSLRDAMDRLFEDSFITPKSVGSMPKIDVKDKTNEVVVRAELPGIAEEDVKVEICDNVVTVSGEKKAEIEKKDEDYYYRESHIGAFSRSVSLPSEVDADKAKADMEKGVLILTIPKIEPKKSKKVSLRPKKK